LCYTRAVTEVDWDGLRAAAVAAAARSIAARRGNSAEQLRASGLDDAADGALESQKTYLALAARFETADQA